MLDEEMEAEIAQSKVLVKKICYVMKRLERETNHEDVYIHSVNSLIMKLSCSKTTTTLQQMTTLQQNKDHTPTKQ